MRIVLFLLLAPTAATIVVGGVTDGNPLAQGLAIGFVAPVCLLVAVLTAPARRPSRKADPAKIARMERELGLVEEPKPPKGCTDPDCPHEHYTVGGFGTRVCLPAEAPTTVQRGPTNANPATFHGAPTFGHKIEGP